VSGDLTPEEIVRVNSHELTALQLVTQRERWAEERMIWEARLRGTMLALTEAQRVGLRVLEAHRAGRKTVRVADMLDQP